MVASDRPKVVILGSVPNRIGQGVEFDYCCVQASFALHDAGFETVMVNCNPETVSTDYDTSDRLYFEPVTREDVQNVLDVEQAGGRGGGRDRGPRRPDPPQALLRHRPRPGHGHLARRRSTWPRTGSAGTPCASGCGIPQAAGGTATSLEEALVIAAKVGLPGPGPPELRAGGPGHGDRLRRGGPRPGHGRHGRLGVARAGRAGCPPNGPCWWTGSWRTPSRWTSTPCATRTGET